MPKDAGHFEQLQRRDGAAEVEGKLAVKTGTAAKMIDMSAIWLKKDRLRKEPIGPPFVRKGKSVLYPMKGLLEWLNPK